MKNPFSVIKSQHVTEKTQVLLQLQYAESNRSVAAFKNPVYTFIVDVSANKQEIAAALEQIYSDKNISVVAVNTAPIPRKQKRRNKGRPGFTKKEKKAYVTLAPGNSLD
ncbi:MAG: rplW [Chlamydiales bacterium]|jgi:large subunit ribosomal protein L23|nr:rplW [Chlamydiales bacterium]